MYGTGYRTLCLFKVPGQPLSVFVVLRYVFRAFHVYCWKKLPSPYSLNVSFITSSSFSFCANNLPVTMVFSDENTRELRCIVKGCKKDVNEIPYKLPSFMDHLKKQKILSI